MYQGSTFLGRTLQRTYERDDYPCSLREVGDELGVTPERVRQIQNQALKKLRAGLEAKGFCLADLLPSFDIHDCAIEQPDNRGLGRYMVDGAG